MNPRANSSRSPARLAPLFLLVLVLLAHSASGAVEAVVEERLRAAEVALQARNLPAAAEAMTEAAEASPDPTLADRATQVTFSTGFDALAERAVSRWVSLAPENPLPRELLGRLKLRRHAVDDAMLDLTAALGTAEPRRDEVYLALAADLASEEDAAGVTRALARLAAQDPLAPGLQLALGNAALRSGDYELALGAARAAALDDPDWPEAQLLMARALVGAGRKDEGLARAEALSTANANPLLDIEHARLLADVGKVAEARALLATLEVQYGQRPEIIRTLAFLDLADGDLESADRRFDALDDEGAERFEAFYYRGQIAARRGDGEAARRYFSRISSGSYQVPAQLASAESLVLAGQAAEAVGQLDAFAMDHPGQAVEVLEYKAQVLQQMKRPEAALAVYDEALRHRPARVSVLLARGALLEQEGRLGPALADLQRAAELVPDDAVALNAYGYVLANRTREARKAWTYVRRAYELQPDSAPIQDSVGWTLFKLGRLEEARSHLEEALARLSDPEIASHLAEVSWRLGDRDTAAALLEAAATEFPDSKPLRETAERLLE